MMSIPEYIEKYLNTITNPRFLSKNDSYVVDFSSNDYLGLSHDMTSLQAGYNAAIKYGSGSSGSRLLSGNFELFNELESEIASAKKYEDCLVFNSGFIANYSVVSALSISETTLVFDKLNHASMYLAVDKNIKLKRYRHLDYNQLEDILKKSTSSNIVIASETVFGMDGDIADIAVLSYLSNKYGAVLYLDEAHATGLYGDNGYGLSLTLDLNKELSIVMGTFSKALASNGAYVTCSNIIKQYLVQKSKGLIYSTALSPFNIGVALHNWKSLPGLNKRRQYILALAEYLRQEVTKIGLHTTSVCTNIVPILFDNVKDMWGIYDSLNKAGIRVAAIRPPTSPTARIRLAINSTHNTSDINKLLHLLKSF